MYKCHFKDEKSLFLPYSHFVLRWQEGGAPLPALSSLLMMSLRVSPLTSESSLSSDSSQDELGG